MADKMQALGEQLTQALQETDEFKALKACLLYTSPSPRDTR